MAVYDCCMFWIENDLFEIRLNEHWNFVDKFIVIEAGETHTGLKKSFNFDHKRFEPWKEKIVYVKFDSFETEMKLHPELMDEHTTADRGENKHSMDWTRDHFQGNYMVKALKDIGAKDDDIIYASCCDELLNEDAWQASLDVFKENRAETPIIMFRYWLFAYKFNLLNKHYSQTDTSGMMTKFSEFKKTLPATLREFRVCTDIVEDAGWHFTFLDNSGGEQVLAKQRSWAHSRDIMPNEKVKFNNKTVHEAVAKLFEDYPVTPVDITAGTHPKYLVENLEKFKDYVLDFNAGD